MYKVELKDLTAKDLQSIATKDDILVIYHVDGDDVRDPYFHRHGFGAAGDSYHLSRAFPYDTELSITLYEEDSVSDDTIATETISDTSATEDTLTFSGEGAEYELDYAVTDEGATSAAEIAHDDFDSSNKPGEWDNVDKDAVISSLETVATPPNDADGDGMPDVYELAQGDIGYCANIAIAFSLAWRKPRRFIEACRAMYELGGFMSRTEEQSISGGLLRSPVPTAEIDHLEWLFSASIEDADNWIDSVSHDDQQAGAYSDFQIYWLDQIVGYDNAAETDDANATQDVRDASNTALNNGGTAILGIDGDMVKFGPDGYLNRPGQKAADDMELNHAVTLTANFQSGGGNTNYTIHTWADRRTPNHPTNVVDNYLYHTIVGWD